MASTRSKNNEGDYALEQLSNTNMCDYLTSQKNNLLCPLPFVHPY